MRPSVLALFLIPTLAIAQPDGGETRVADAFGRFVSSAHRDGVSATANFIACPIETGGERPVAGICDMALAAHRVRVERLTALAAVLFPSEPTALNPHYNVEEEGDGRFHLLLFADIASADYVLAAFMDVDGTFLLTNLDTEGGPEQTPPPPSVVQALEALLVAASSDSTTVERFAQNIVARTDDPEREWNAPADPSRPNEREFVESALASIRILMEGSHGDFEIDGYEIEEESEGEWHVLHVRFDTHDIDVRRSFAFLPVGNSLLLGDIDG